MIGAPKVATVLWSGEMRDTAQLGPMLSSLKEQYMTRKTVREGFRSMPSYWSLLPMGGARVWGGLREELGGDGADEIAAGLLEAQRKAVLSWNGTGYPPDLRAVGREALLDSLPLRLRPQGGNWSGAGTESESESESNCSRSEDPERCDAADGKQSDGDTDTSLDWVGDSIEPMGTVSALDQEPGGSLLSRFVQLHDAEAGRQAGRQTTRTGAGAGAGRGKGSGRPTLIGGGAAGATAIDSGIGSPRSTVEKGHSQGVAGSIPGSASPDTADDRLPGPGMTLLPSSPSTLSSAAAGADGGGT